MGVLGFGFGDAVERVVGLWVEECGMVLGAEVGGVEFVDVAFAEVLAGEVDGEGVV